MNRTQARAILRLNRVVNRAVDSCLRAFPPGEQEYAEVYWAGALKACVNGKGYGSVPVWDARDKLEEAGQ